MDERESYWHGNLERSSYTKESLAALDALSNAAKGGKWDNVIAALKVEPSFLTPNRWRVGGRSWYTPLHQAAWHNAPGHAVDALLAGGAWRTLRTAQGETARDIASRRGYHDLAERLEPEPSTRVDPRVLARLDAHLESLVNSRIRPQLDVQLRYPATSVLTEIGDLELWFPVPGMYGGFSIRLMRSYLFVRSWCRVVGGSGQAHVVTAEGSTLVEEGFV